MAGKKKGDDAKDGEGAEEGKGGGKLKLVLMVLPTLALVAFAAFYFLGGSDSKAATPAAKPKPTPGPVVVLDPITINLAGGHYLKLGIDLQPTADAGEALNGGQALDAAITLYSGKGIDEIASTKGRTALKKELVEQISKLYEEKVYDIYFTTYVYQ